MIELVKILSFTLLLTTISFARAPAVEELDQLNQEMLEREKAGKSYSSQYAAIVDKKKVTAQNTQTLTIALVALLLVIFPLVMWQMLLNVKEVTRAFDKENLPDSVFKHFSTNDESDTPQNKQEKEDHKRAA